MSTETSNQPNPQDFWAGFGHWLRAIDDSVHDDPNEALVRRVENLEARLVRLEAPETGRAS